ncbi:peptidase associated/transthyretin-like domain-containing protein [Sphingobacterium lactis]|nr:hypothetical protein [Sphingobacterium lactis]
MSFAQVQFTVVDSQRKPIQGAIVSIHDLADEVTFAHTTSDQAGKVMLKETTFPFLLKVRSMSYKPYSAKITTKVDIQEYVVLSESAIAIEEVVADMNKGFASLRNDTIKFNLNALNLAGSDNLKEILNRIPGFRVDENYKITHAGQEINKILVNGKEAFEFQNKIALDNIENAMLDGLSVINDYRDPFQVNLEEGKTDKVINLTLKEDFSNIIKGNIELMGGYKHKFKIKPFLFYFSEGLAVFSLNNLNNMYDKDWSSEDYSGGLQSYNLGSRYFRDANRSTFYAKDLTLNRELSFLNSTTVKRTTDQYTFQAVINYNVLSSLKFSETNTRYLGNSLYDRLNTDSLKASMFSYMLNFKHKLFKTSILELSSSNYSDKLIRDDRFNATYHQEQRSFFVEERATQGSTIYAHKINLDSKISNKIAWSTSYSLKTENSGDLWVLQNSNGIADSPILHPENDIKLKNKEHTINSSLHYNFAKGMSGSVGLAYFRTLDKVDRYLLQFKSNRLSPEVEVHIKTKFVNVEANLNYNRLHRYLAEQTKKVNYFAGNLNADIFLDNYKKNKIRISLDKSALFAPITAALPYNVDRYDHVLFGQSDLFFENFDRIAGRIAYVYDLPFKGESFQLAVFGNSSSNTIIQTLNKENNRFWTYQRVKGLKRYGGDVYYSHNMLKNSYPLKVDVSYRITRDSYFQFLANEEVPIVQDNHIIQACVNSFSENRINGMLKISTEITSINYNDSETSKQENYSLLFGPRYNHKKLVIKTFLKYSFIKDRQQSNSFLDMNLSTRYSLSDKLELLLEADNFLQNLGLKSADPLGLVDNQQGMEYFQSYKNLVGYTTLGFRYKF